MPFTTVYVAGDFKEELKLFDNNINSMIDHWNTNLQLFVNNSRCKIINLKGLGSYDIKMTILVDDIDTTNDIVNLFNHRVYWFGRKIEFANTKDENLYTTIDCYNQCELLG